MEQLKYPGSMHNHTDFSNFRFRDSTIPVNKLIDRAIQLGHKVVAITEHETIASAIRAENYYAKIKKDNPDFKVIFGNEIYLCRNGLNASNFNREYDKYYHFILLAKDEIGHKQIREISSRAWMRSYMAKGLRRAPTYYQDIFDIIGANPGHVIGSTACLGGALATQLLKYRATRSEGLLEKIMTWCRQLKNTFGEGDFYFEMQPSFNEEQIFVNKAILKLSEELDIPYIITNDSHYLRKEDQAIHKAYLNAQDGDREVDAFYATTYLMTDEEIRHYMFSYLGEENLQQAYKNIMEIKEKCSDFSLKKPLKIPRLTWKNFDPIYDPKMWCERMPYLRNFLESPYEEDRLLAQAVVQKVQEDQYLRTPAAYAEIDACLKDTWVSSEVNGSRWSAYFLNLQNIIDSCWNSNTLVGAGRGSGVGFILLYILDIIQINPLREKSQTKRWRFLNPDRVSPLDVDIDIESKRREDVLKNFRKQYGEDRVANVLTIKTEKSKSAILTAARGLGIDVDIAQYLSSMIASDRGQIRTLDQTYNGDIENGFEANHVFRREMDENYPELWEVAKSIEGLVCGMGVHAGGVIFVDEPFENYTSLMRAPSGEIITQFDLHDAEATGLIKYDILSVEALDKIHVCIDLLAADGRIPVKETLRQTYETTVGIYNLIREEQDMWKMCWEHKVLSLFQMEKQSGIQGIAILKPTSVDDLAILNSTIRLMAQEKGAEMPTQKLARFKKDPTEWDDELKYYGLGQREKEILAPVLETSYGLCIAQEQFMQLVQLPELGGFDLTFADRLRKSIAKKNPAEYEAVTKEFFEKTAEKGCNYSLCNYVWNVLIAMSRGYGFNLSHTLAYSLIGLQELNLAYRFPIEYWNCACLISDSGGEQSEEEEEESVESVWDSLTTSYEEEVIEDFCDPSEEDDEEEEEEKGPDKKKKKAATTNYGKIAAAIGKMTSEGIKISPPDINTSSYTFSPDPVNHTIHFGLSGITRVGKDLITTIMNNRPYTSLTDFLNKVKVTKPQMVNLIKSGAFDSFGDRVEVMWQYIELISEPKKRITLQNMKALIDFKLLPEELDFECKVYNFNKYIKKFKEGKYYYLDEIAFNFYEKNFDMDKVEPYGDGFVIGQITWDNIYKKKMDKVRDYIKPHQQELLDGVNLRLKQDLWNKYCQGNISKWEMDAVSCYFHEHELANVDLLEYNFADFNELPENPVVERFIPIKGSMIPILKIDRIIGTVLDRDKAKKMVTLLTPSGVVTVKIFGPVFAEYDKPISQKGADGKKHVVEKSLFTRGNKIIVTGIRREDSFIGKKYSKTPFHLIEQIVQVDDNGDILIKRERAEAA